LLGEEIRQILELPLEQSPLNGAGPSCFRAGHKARVLIVWTRPEAPTCTTRPGTPVFLFTFFTECSRAEPPPFFGATEAEQRRCAVEDLRTFGLFDAILISIDGQRPTNIYSDRYVAVSPQV
jgi:hypothetical protein